MFHSDVVAGYANCSTLLTGNTPCQEAGGVLPPTRGEAEVAPLLGIILTGVVTVGTEVPLTQITVIPSIQMIPMTGGVESAPLQDMQTPKQVQVCGFIRSVVS